MISPAEARERLRAHLEPSWPHESLCVTMHGWEDEDFYEFGFGTREWIEEGDRRYATTDAVHLIDKRTGQVTVHAHGEPGILARVGAMTRVSADPALEPVVA
jgi:hypothetical protein